MSSDEPGLFSAEERVPKGFSRRAMLRAGATIAAIAGTVPTVVSAKSDNTVRMRVRPTPAGNPHPIFGDNTIRRTADFVHLRASAARAYLQSFAGKQETNGDEGKYADFRASFTKALPHDDNGIVERGAYQKLLTALRTGRDRDFEVVPLGGRRKLANPQGAYRFELTGRDGQATFMRPAPTFAGAETAAEMGELYWKAICRDIPFSDYEFSPMIAAAAMDLNAFSATVGPKVGGRVTPACIFRGETPGDLVGPYISQFLLMDIPFGNSTIVQRYAAPSRGADFMTSFESWLAVQRGAAPLPLEKGNARYITDGRALGEYVHVDFTYQAFLSAALILLAMPNSFDTDNLYNSSSTQGGFVSLGGPDVLDLVAKAGNLSLTGAWYQKWLVHRRLRPETYGGRLHKQIIDGTPMNLPSEIFQSEGVARTFARTGSYLLPMAFPEGSPTHPSYPAGHATIAGACSTVLKAFFEESRPIDNPVVPDALGARLQPYNGTLTIGGEINKLANNISLGRDWAGVHYRSDGVDGLLVGEMQALGLLLDYSLTYRESFKGFSLTTFEGKRIRIQNGRIL